MLNLHGEIRSWVSVRQPFSPSVQDGLSNAIKARQELVRLPPDLRSRNSRFPAIRRRTASVIVSISGRVTSM